MSMSQEEKGYTKMRDENGQFTGGYHPSTEYKKGNIPVAPFKKGYTPWNKGKSHLKKEDNPNWIGGKQEKKCEYCHNEFMAYASQKRSYCSRVCKAQATKTFGTDHPKWVEDRTKLVTSEKKHLDTRYKNWVSRVKNKDGWVCQMSGDDCNGRLEAHHILAWRSHPELRYKTNNGITLCHFHHPRVWEEEKRLAPVFQVMVTVSRGLI